jgi:hypothetical protein
LPADKGKIDVNEPGEIIWWSNHLGVGLEIILSLVKKVVTQPNLCVKSFGTKQCCVAFGACRNLLSFEACVVFLNPALHFPLL